MSRRSGRESGGYASGGGGCGGGGSLRRKQDRLTLRALLLLYSCVGFACRASSVNDAGSGGEIVLQQRSVVSCDQQLVFVSCPSSTVVDVVRAHYGRTVPGSVVCPYAHQDGYHLEHEQVVCSVGGALLAVMQLCQERRSCKLNVTPKAFGRDPCPRVGKYLNITYRCMPSKYMVKSACEGYALQLACNNSQRLFIESVSSWKSSTGVIGCSLTTSTETLWMTDQMPGIVDSGACAEADANSIRRFCSGKRRCSLDDLRSACRNDSLPPTGELRRFDVSYACISRSTLLGSSVSDQEQRADRSTIKSFDDGPASLDRKQAGGAGAAAATVPGGNAKNAQLPQNDIPVWKSLSAQPGRTTGDGCTDSMKQSADADRETTGPASDSRQSQQSQRGDQRHVDNLLMGWAHSLKYARDNEEKLTLYGLLCGCVALLLALGAVTARLLYRRRLRHRRARSGSGGKLSGGGSEPLTGSDRCSGGASGGGSSSGDGNTYVPALDPSDVALLSYHATPGGGVGACSSSSSYNHSSLLFRSDDVRKTFYENDDSNESDRTARVNSLYDRHS